MQRSAVITGPAKITFNGAVIYSQADITLDVVLETFDIQSSAHGKVDERRSNAYAKLSFVPVGEWESLAVMFPYANYVVGASVFTDNDIPLVINSADGKSYTFPAAAITQMANVFLGATQTLFEQMEFSMIRADDEDWEDANSLLEIAEAAFTDTDFTRANVITQPYSASWGSTSPWDAIETEAGWKINFNLQLQPISVDRKGIIDWRYQNLEVMATAVPLGPTESDIVTAMKVQGVGAKRGSSLGNGQNDLVITGTGVSVTLTQAAIKTAGFRFGPTVIRNGEVGFLATRKFVDGAPVALFSVGTGS